MLRVCPGLSMMQRWKIHAHTLSTKLLETMTLTTINTRIRRLIPMIPRIYLSSVLLVLLLIVPGCIIEENDPTVDVRTVEFLFSIDDAIINGDVASVQFTVPAITPDVVDFGGLLVYFREQGTWTAMPFTFGVESPELPAVDYTITLGYGYDDGFIEVFYEASTEEAPLFAQPDRLIKVVILDDLAFRRVVSMDSNSYERIKAEFQLEE